MGVNSFIQIGNRIKHYRQNLGLSQSYMAQRLGIQRSTYSNYENNIREPKKETIEKIAQILDIDVTRLIHYDVLWELEEELSKNAPQPSLDDLIDTYNGVRQILCNTLNAVGIHATLTHDYQNEFSYLNFEGISISDTTQEELFKDLNSFLKYKAFEIKNRLNNT